MSRCWACHSLASLTQSFCMKIRKAHPATDAGACAAIYAPYARNTIISFEYEPPGAEEFERRLASSLGWFVAENEVEVVGYAYLAKHRERSAYQWAADAAVYVRESEHRSGVGRLLYTKLIEVAKAGGLRMLCAGVTQPNEASNGFHEAIGFELVGVYRRIGWKFGSWHDVRWYQLDLAPGDSSPPEMPRFDTS